MFEQVGRAHLESYFRKVYARQRRGACDARLHVSVDSGVICHAGAEAIPDRG